MRGRRRTLLLLLVVACSGVTEQVRRVTYPPDLRYIERQEIAASMRDLAMSALALDTRLRDKDRPQDELQEDVLGHLTAMELAAAQLDGPGRATHPLIDQNLPAFRRDIAAAKAAAAADPPDYFLAGSVVGSCRYCHRMAD